MVFLYISQNKILLLYIFKIKNMVSSPNKYFIQFLKSRHECFEEWKKLKKNYEKRIIIWNGVLEYTTRCEYFFFK